LKYLKRVNGEFRAYHGAEFAMNTGFFHAWNDFRVMIALGIDFF
jgi:hypothetical protein